MLSIYPRGSAAAPRATGFIPKRSEIADESKVSLLSNQLRASLLGSCNKQTLLRGTRSRRKIDGSSREVLYGYADLKIVGCRYR